MTQLKTNYYASVKSPDLLIQKLREEERKADQFDDYDFITDNLIEEVQRVEQEVVDSINLHLDQRRR